MDISNKSNREGYVPIPLWVPVKGYESKYRVFDRGIVMRLPHPVRHKNGLRYLKSVPLKGTVSSSTGYIVVGLYSGEEGARGLIHSVHRIVALSFLSNPRNVSDVNHKNGIKTDPSVYNLEWVSRAENNFHAYRVLGKKSVDLRGEKNGQAKLKLEAVIEIKRLNGNFSGLTKRKAAEVVAIKYGVSRASILSIWEGRNWSKVAP